MNIQKRCLDVFEASGMTQTALAEASGIDKGDLSKLLRSPSPRFTFRRILQLAGGFQKTPEEMLEGVDEIDGRLQQDLDFWLKHLSEGLAAKRDLSRLQQTLQEMHEGVAEKFIEMEQRHAEALSRARSDAEEADRARDEMRHERDSAADQANAARLREDQLTIERNQLRLDLKAARASVVDLRAEVERLRSELSSTRVTSGALGALFGAVGTAALMSGAGDDEPDDDDDDDDDYYDDED